MFKQLIDILKKNPKKIVFTEGSDPRILEASARLLSGTFLTPILIGKEEEIRSAAEEIGYNIRGAEIYDPEHYGKMDAMVEKMVELRKGKMTPDECREVLKRGNYFGTMLVAMGEADALLGGATYSTADTVRPALQLVKTKPGNKIVSSCFILVRPYATGGNMVLAMGDCAINIKPTEDELVEIATETAKCAQIFGVEPKIAFLSYSTFGSGKGEDVDKMRNACQKAKAYLEERGAAYDARDIKLENPSAEELRAWWQRSGLPLKRFFNTSGLQYRALGLKDKLADMSEEEQLSLLAADGMLVKRPLLVTETAVLPGFKEEAWREALQVRG